MKFYHSNNLQLNEIGLTLKLQHLLCGWTPIDTFMVVVQMQIICLFVVGRNESTSASCENFEKVGDDKWMFVEKLKEAKLHFHFYMVSCGYYIELIAYFVGKV